MDQTNQNEHPLILFDGVCNLCNAAVRWLIHRDPQKQFRFASLQSEAAANTLREAGLEGKSLDSIVLIDQGKVFTRSSAALAIAWRLGFPWSLALAGHILPRRLRDGIYDWVARNRYRWFGRRNACMLPTPELRELFLDSGDTRPPDSKA